MQKSQAYIAAQQPSTKQPISHLSLSAKRRDAGSDFNTNLRSRVPYYVYTPAASATQLKTGKHAVVIFLHGKGEQRPSVNRNKEKQLLIFRFNPLPHILGTFVRVMAEHLADKIIATLRLKIAKQFSQTSL